MNKYEEIYDLLMYIKQKALDTDKPDNIKQVRFIYEIIDNRKIEIMSKGLPEDFKNEFPALYGIFKPEEKTEHTNTFEEIKKLGVYVQYLKMKEEIKGDTNKKKGIKI